VGWRVLKDLGEEDENKFRESESKLAARWKQAAGRLKTAHSQLAAIGSREKAKGERKLPGRWKTAVCFRAGRLAATRSGPQTAGGFWQTTYETR